MPRTIHRATTRCDAVTAWHTAYVIGQYPLFFVMIVTVVFFALVVTVALFNNVIIALFPLIPLCLVM